MGRKQTSWPAAVMTAALLLAASGAAAEQDHLIGVKAKDLAQTPAPPSVTISSSLVSGACELKKVQFMLLQADKNAGDDPRGGTAGNFVCYKAKCPNVPPPTMADTQFGTVNMESKKAKIICLPADAAICGDGGLDPTESCDGDDDDLCPGLCRSDCTCTPCTGGQVSGGSCWYLGAPGENCAVACANHALGYDTATETVAGSAGDDLICGSLLMGFGRSYLQPTTCADGLGCHYDTSAANGLRCTAPPTSPIDSAAGVERVCACR